MNHVSRAVAAIEERFLVPAYASPRAALWIAGHAGLALPLQLAGRVRRYVARVGDDALRVVTVGRMKHCTPPLERWLGDLEPRVSAAPARWRSAWHPGALSALDADIIAVEVHRWLAPRYARAGWAVIPDAVRWLGDPRAIPTAKPGRSVGNDLRAIVKYGYTLEIADTPTPADWDEFYSAMVLPHARRRFATDSWHPSDRLRREFAAAGHLHFVQRDGVRVAGICAIATGNRLWYPLLGVRADNPDLLRQGATAAALVLSFRWAREHGFEHADLGRTSSFLSDGVHRFKRKWGLQPARDPLAHRVALWVHRASEGLRRILEREPVLIETAAGLETFAGAVS